MDINRTTHSPKSPKKKISKVNQEIVDDFKNNTKNNILNNLDSLDLETDNLTEQDLKVIVNLSLKITTQMFKQYGNKLAENAHRLDNKN